MRLMRIFKTMAVIISVVAFAGLLGAVFATDTDRIENDAGRDETSLDDVSVTLPADIPFNIVLPKNGGKGFVDSKAFQITNNGANPIGVTLGAVQLSVSNIEAFSISDSEILPDEGNNIYVSLICVQDGVSEAYAVTGKPRVAHTFWLAGGESAEFRIGGTVNERGETPWSASIVTISLRFTVVNLDGNLSNEPEEAETDAEAPLETNTAPEVLPEFGTEIPPEQEADTPSTPEAQPETETPPTSETQPGTETLPVSKTEILTEQNAETSPETFPDQEALPESESKESPEQETKILPESVPSEEIHVNFDDAAGKNALDKAS
jgi:hypothetical protein